MAAAPDFWQRNGVSARLLAPLAMLYGGVSAVRRLAFRRGWLKTVAAPVPVIVVGNVSVGGTGKTPFVAWLVARLQAHGYRPGIVARGYGSRAGRGPVAVSTEADPAAVGDEPLLLARRCRVPVRVGADRPAAVAACVEAGCDIVVSDDGLQHYRMGRDLEIVVIDGQHGFGNARLLPAGPLRESPRRLATVDLVVARDAPHPETPYVFRLRPGAPRALDGSRRPWPGGMAYAVAGIGRPQRFFATVREQGINAECHAFPDHHPFRASDLDFIDPTRPILMTEKDAVKCRELPQRERIWWLPVAVSAEPALVAALEQRLAGLRRRGEGEQQAGLLSAATSTATGESGGSSEAG
ncbi:tetraacyldisaccharide 4'-kinase [Halorhodospira abdelmalekii]|uniref:tetraacyldisaccharide 4'-kinase n=1 Tax=Halorhodospira abdelmalekii TaxID=421629 RepID=UPI0030846E5B